MAICYTVITSRNLCNFMQLLLVIKKLHEPERFLHVILREQIEYTAPLPSFHENSFNISKMPASMLSYRKSQLLEKLAPLYHTDVL